MADDIYYYELKYVYNDVEITHKFSADICIDVLTDRLKDFLKACSWHESTLNKTFKGDDEI